MARGTEQAAEPAGGTEDDGALVARPKRSQLFFYHATGSAIILLLAAILRTLHAMPGCADKLNDGHWLAEDVWQPKLCTLSQFHSRGEVEECMAPFSQVVVVGAEKWAAAAHLLCPASTGVSKRKHYIDQSNSCEEGGQIVVEYINLAQSSEDKGPVLVIHQPLYHLAPLKEGQSPADTLSTCRGLVMVQAKAQQELLSVRPGSLILQLDSNPIWRSGAEPGVDATQVYREVYTSAQQNTSRLLYLTSPFETGFSHRMISSSKPASLPSELSLLLNTFCASTSSSSSSSSTSSSCCIHTSHYFTVTILVFILASYVGVGLILLSGATFALIPHLEAVSFNLERFIAQLHSVGGGAFVFLYVLMVDGLGYFPSEERSYSPWLFVVCVSVVAAVAALTSDKTDTSETLSSAQCNAWRGTLVLIYITLHYCGIDQVVAGQLFGELLVGGLVFVSGYTHFCRHWKQPDFSWRRIGTVLFELNVLPVLLGLTLGMPYAVYGLPVLLTLGFLFTSVFMASWPQMTPASLQGMSVQGPQHVVVAVKFGFAFLFISFLPWMKGAAKGLLSLPLSTSVVGTGADARNLYHWIYTQRYMTLGGMAFGYVMCNIQSNSVSTASGGLRGLKLVTIPFSLLIMLGYGIFLLSATNFEQSSESQSLIAQPVIMSYALLRYFSHPLQRYESGLLAGLGSLSVWLFVSHQHILLNQSGSTLLALFSHAPWPVNFAVALCVFFFCLRLMHFARRTLSSSSVGRGSVAHPSPTQSNTRTLPFTDQ